ncbi:two-component sensor histidine kinase [bacterium SCSIO 12696]|nr:two-component sensor histidine kinase [bacterium SCSIO 12696]
MKPLLHSLAGRFVLASVILLPVFLGLSGLALERSFQRSQQAALQEQLKSYVYLLMGAAELDADQLWMPEQLTEPRFNQLHSGLVAYITDAEQLLWQSASSLDIAIQTDEAALLTGQQNFQPIAISNLPYHRFYYDVSWQQESGSNRLLRFAVAQHSSALDAQRLSFRQQLWQWLGGLGVFLLIAQLCIMRWGLRPLDRVAADLAAIESGQKQQLAGRYPREITAVTDNLNRVLNSERQQRERYRNTMADLAHSLKTPLAVIRGQLSTSAKDDDINQQVERMDQIVQHQLQRAVGGSNANKNSTPVAPAVEKLARTLGKIYRDNGVTITTAVDANCEFNGDDGDLLELLGNLLDNSCKYGAGQVEISGHMVAEQLELIIDDNGPGIPDAHRQVILQRGARADTAQNGQGIGLAVVVDIVSSYNGELLVEESPLGGARFRVVLP